MSLKKDLAARLRQSVQGCTLHLHGPIQAWQAIEEACADKKVSCKEIADEAMDACTSRIEHLLKEGVSSDDQRIIKEELTRDFIGRLLLGKSKGEDPCST